MRADETNKELVRELAEAKSALEAMKTSQENISRELAVAMHRIRESDEKFMKAFLTNPDSININRLSDGLYISINKGFTNVMGYTEEDCLGKTSGELMIWVNPADRQIVIKCLREKGILESFEAPFRRKDGATVYGLMSASIIEVNGEECILSITKDISQRKQMEEALDVEQFLSNALLDNITDMVYFKDRESKFIRINKALAWRFGLQSPEMALGKTDFDFFSKEHAQQAYDDEQEIMRTGKILSKEERETHEDKPDLWVSTIKVALRDLSGNIIGTFGISRDITGRKYGELQSQILYEITKGVTSTDKLDELLQLIHKSLARVLYAENIFIALYDENKGLFSFPYFIDKCDHAPQPAPLPKSCTSYVFRTGKPLLLDQELFDKLKEQGEVELVGSNSPSWVGIPLPTPSRIIGVLVLQHYEKENVYTENDIQFLVSIGGQLAISIERKKNEEELKTKNELLQVINAEKDKFFSILAHDLRGPLGSFMTAAGILSEELDSMTHVQVKEISESLKTSASNLYRLLENLLEWSRIKRGTIKFNPERMILLPKIKESVGLLSEMSKNKNISITYSVPEYAEITADVHMLTTIIRNLVSNAIKFTHKGGQIFISAIQVKGNKFEITVRDTGIGMKPEVKDKLFILNENVSRQGTDGESSSGLGLILCKEFIDKHRGSIRVESEAEKGSSFSFIL